MTAVEIAAEAFVLAAVMEMVVGVSLVDAVRALKSFVTGRIIHETGLVAGLDEKMAEDGWGGMRTQQIEAKSLVLLAGPGAVGWG